MIQVAGKMVGSHDMSGKQSGVTLYMGVII